MSKAPIVYRSTHRIEFSELDPYDHVNTGQYATYYVAYCMEGLRDYAGWDLKTLATLPFMVWVRRIEIDFLRPVRGDQEITISSFVRDFRARCAHRGCHGRLRRKDGLPLPHDRCPHRQEDRPGDGLAARPHGGVLRAGTRLRWGMVAVSQLLDSEPAA